MDIDPTNALNFGSLGGVLAKQGRYSDAAEALQRAVQVEPETAPYYARLSDALDRAGQPGEALAASSALWHLLRTVASSKLSDILFRQGRKEEAFSAVRHAIELDPGLAPLYALRAENLTASAT